MKSFTKFFVFVAATSIVGAGVYGYYRKDRVSEPPQPPEPVALAQNSPIDLTDVPLLEALNKEYTKLIRTVVPSVVSINTAKRVVQPNLFVDPFGRVFRGRGGKDIKVPNSLGSGVIVSSEGHIITNNHVISEGETGKPVEEIEVVLSDGRSLAAKVIDTDPETDIAVLKVEGENLVPLPFGDSDRAEVGERVFAVGNPFGLSESVSDGIISAKGRDSMSDENISEFLQTNAAINPGNSGGPLINIRGEIIGINTMIASQSGGFQGIGLAVPSNTARQVFESLVNEGGVRRGYIGIQAIEWTPQIMSQLGFDRPEGAIVGRIEVDSPAAKAGIRPMDVIVRVNGKAVKSFADLRKEVRRADLNDELEIEIMRKGQSIVVRATVMERPLQFSKTPAQPSPRGARATQGSVLAGVEVRELTPRTREELRLSDEASGVVVTALPPGSRAASKLRVNDVIEAINDFQVNSVQDFQAAASELDPNQPSTLRILRERAKGYVVL